MRMERDTGVGGEGELKSMKKKAVLDIPSDGHADGIPAGLLCPAGRAPRAALWSGRVPTSQNTRGEN